MPLPQPNDSLQTPRMSTTINPKLVSRSRDPRHEAFPYYAGFNGAFVESVIRRMAMPPKHVLDPWNGAGTTTSICKKLGFRATGTDINPVMAVVAKAGLANHSDTEDFDAFLTALEPSRTRRTDTSRLNRWFTNGTAMRIRYLEEQIRTAFGPVCVRGRFVSDSSPASCTAYVALFKVLRDAAKIYRTSNPTWRASRKTSSAGISITTNKLYNDFKVVCTRLFEAAGSRQPPPENISIEIAQADSTSYVFPESAFDLVISSPPYCTRIDYTNVTGIEGEVLAWDGPTWQPELSAQMLGTVRVPRSNPPIHSLIGSECRSFLESVHNHDSKASKTYYYKSHVDYYNKLAESLSNISRALTPSSTCILVVQNSFYKDVENDLPKFLSEIASGVGLQQTRREDFPVRRSMVQVNRRASAHNKTNRIRETVLWLEN